MAFSFRGKSDDIPLLKTNLPVSTGPVEYEDDEASPVAPKTRATQAAPEPKPVAAPPVNVIPPADRRAAMNGLDSKEYRWASMGLLVLGLLAIFITVYLAVGHPTKTVTQHHHQVRVPLQASYILYGIALLVFCAFGAFGLYRHKRTIVAFSFILSGFALTLILGPYGFPPIVLGGWLMWRASRIQKYGTANAKEIAKVAATTGPTRRQPRERGRGRAAATPAAQVSETGRKAPTPSKRYTPKSAPRKKVPKPTA
jgi:hypothetical protein